MSPTALSRLWTSTAVLVLGGLWLALLWAPAWTGRLGVVFLSCPILLACLTLWLRAERDRFTTLCVAALVLLFLIAWLL